MLDCKHRRAAQLRRKVAPAQHNVASAPAVVAVAVVSTAMALGLALAQALALVMAPEQPVHAPSKK
jgi:hypothetical protein